MNNEELPLENKYLKQIFEHIQDGIIVMDHNRKIMMMNPSARRLTGWKLGHKVPYCSFCETRKRRPGEDKCYLISREEVPYFLSEMPTYHGDKINVEMSTAMICHDPKTGKKEYLLVLRDQSLKQKEEEVKMSKKMIQKLIEVQESEHKRLAQELHDGVGQSLYTISVALQAIESYVKSPRLHSYLDEVREELEKVMQDIKSYSYQLRPQTLDRLGLIPAIKSLIQSIQASAEGLNIRFVNNVVEAFDPMVEINLYRVIQEALHNIVKYAHATDVKIELRVKKGQLLLVIQDNGVGFDLDQEKDGLGLKHMSERIDQLSGSFRIWSQVGKGTTIWVRVPLERESIADDQSFNRR